MTSIARALRITGRSLGLTLLVLTAGPHSVARAQHGAQIQKTCVNATRFACLQGTTFGCPGINAGDACRTAADCPGGGLQTVCVGGRTTAGVPRAPTNASDAETGGLTPAIYVGGPNGGTPWTYTAQGPRRGGSHCELDPNKLCMSQDDCAPAASGACVFVFGRQGDQVNVPLHPH